MSFWNYVPMEQCAAPSHIASHWGLSTSVSQMRTMEAPAWLPAPAAAKAG